MENKELILAIKMLRDDLTDLWELSAKSDDRYLDEVAAIEIALSKIEMQEGLWKR